jgi:hypothetical protein
MSTIVDIRPLPLRGVRRKRRYVPPLPCNHEFGEVLSLEEIASVPLRTFAGRRRFKNQAQVCAKCGLVIGVMR